MKYSIGLIVYCLTLVLSVQKAAAEVCVDDAWYPGHYKLCVSSVLSSQGGNNYGPENLSPRGEGNGAWCEGVNGNGIGQTISFKFGNDIESIGFIEMINGYAKSKAAFANNGRIRSLEVTSDRGMIGTFEFADSDFAEMRVPQAKYKWIQMKVMSVYPGKKYLDVCVTAISPM